MGGMPLRNMCLVIFPVLVGLCCASPGLAPAQDQGSAPVGPSADAPAEPSDDRADPPKGVFAGASEVSPTAVRSILVQKPGQLAVVLNNGLTLLIKEHHTAPVAAVRMYVKTGAIYEQEYLGTGISHLFEHLLHGGSTSTRDEVATEKIMISMGNNSNAYTTTDHTCYYINTTRGHVNTAIGLLADFITNPIWPDNEFQREWQVVQRELERSDNDPGYQLHYAQMEALYTIHPARYRTIGFRSAIQELTRQDIIDYYKRMYVPDNVVVSVAGDFKIDEALPELQKAFAGFTRRPVRNVTLPPEPPVGSPRTVIRTLPTTKELLFSLNYPTVELTDADLYPLDVLAFVLGTGESSRLARNVRDKGLGRGLACHSYTPNWGAGMFSVSGRTVPEKWEACRQGVSEEIQRVTREPISEEELAKAKRLKVAEHVFGHQTAESVASSLARSFISTGDPLFDEYYTQRIQDVTAEQILAVARKYLVNDRLCSAFVAPPGFTLAPDESEASAVARSDVIPRKLDNGLQVLLKQEASAPLVAMQFFLKGGQVGETARQAGWHAMIGQLITRGTETRSADEIAAYFDSIGGQIGGSGQRHTLGVSCQVLTGDFDEAFDVFADVVRNPTFPQAQLDIFQPIVVSRIKALPEHLEAYTFDMLEGRVHLRSPYGHRRIGTIETVEAMKSDALRSFYKGRLCGRDAVLAVVGDVDVAATFSKIEAAFGSLPADPQVPLPEPEKDPPIDQDEVYVIKSDQAAAMVMLAYRGTTLTDEDDLTKLTVIDTIISGYGYPSGWLHTDLRGRAEGLTYAVHAFNAPGVVPRLFAAYANCQPNNAGRVFEIITQNFAKAARGRFTPEELAEAKDQIYVNEQMSNQTAAEIAMQIAVNTSLGRPYDWDDPEKLKARLEKVTMETLKATARKYLTHYVAVITTPTPDDVKLKEGLRVHRVGDPAADKK